MEIKYWIPVILSTLITILGVVFYFGKWQKRDDMTEKSVNEIKDDIKEIKKDIKRFIENNATMRADIDNLKEWKFEISKNN